MCSSDLEAGARLRQQRASRGWRGPGAEVIELLRIIRASGGVERARDRALAFHAAATAALEVLPDRPERAALAAIADFVVRRVR